MMGIDKKVRSGKREASQEGKDFLGFLDRLFYEPTSIAPLAVFRVIFGGMMLISIIRFAVKGWIYDLYIAPTFYFPYLGFEWIKPLGDPGMYILFIFVGLSSFLIMVGLFYRFAIICFFLGFTYIELIDKTNYLNHYYFISLVAFLMIWVPANRNFSLDLLRMPCLFIEKTPAWCINIFKLQLAIVYIFAGIAKLHPDWLVEALPLRLWLPAKSHLPYLGNLLEEVWIAYAFSWVGALYDLFIVFFLLNSRTRPFAYIAVVSFHLMTAALFPIGMFPYIMILSTLIFFPPSFHKKLIENLKDLSGKILGFPRSNGFFSISKNNLTMSKNITLLLSLYFLLQLIIPFRYGLYSGNLLWTEEGYRFSWRVMLMEKSGYVSFHVQDSLGKKYEQVNNYDHLTSVQEKMMSTQPDMILQFAHYLKVLYQEKGFEAPQVRAESYVSLNGRRSQVFIDPNVDLGKISPSLRYKDWVLPQQTK